MRVSTPRRTRNSLGFPMVGLLGAAHPGPAVAVTVLAGLLAVATDAAPGRIALVVGAVLTGQLSIGWSNDLVDLARDRQVGRTDKPIASGRVPEGAARLACGVVVVATVPLSLACGVVAGSVQLSGVVAGWAYNLGLKATPWSWVPYAVAFGGLPVFVSLAARPAEAVPPWLPVAGALLGIGAHLVNVLPDLDDDAATGIRGLPHRLGARWTPRVAVVVLIAASLTIAAGSGGNGARIAVPALAAVLALGLVALVAPGRAPFRAAVGIALVDVVMLLVAR